MFLREPARNARRRPLRDAARWRAWITVNEFYTLALRLVLLLVEAYGYEHAAEVLENLAGETRAAGEDDSTYDTYCHSIASDDDFPQDTAPSRLARWQ